jgi:hypothetical protein
LINQLFAVHFNTPKIKQAVPRYVAPSTGGFGRNSPQGRCREASRCLQGLGCSFKQPLAKASARRINAVFGCRFFWVLFFGQAKKSSPLAGAVTGIQSGFAIAKH